jgi:hypothetical protein
MFLQKSSCIECKQAYACSYKTRCMVNYCGSQRKTMEPFIHQAKSACKALRGSMMVMILNNKNFRQAA